MRNKYVLVAVVLVVLGFGVGQLSAGSNLDSPAGPTEPAAQMYTLEQIHDRLDSGAAATKMTQFTEPAAGPGSTMHDLNDIMAIIPDEGSDVTGPEGTATFHIPDGIYRGKTATAIDSDLVAGNIRCGVTIFDVTGSMLPECVRKTGQTACWDSDGSSTPCAGTGQDGEYQKGCLPIRASGLVGYLSAGYNRQNSFTCSGGFTDNGNGTVTDNLTGLIWLKAANCLTFRTWAQALSDANGLTSGSCGLTDGSSAGDWRVPNINELRSLFNPTSPYVPAGHPFTGASGLYWSSTTDASCLGEAWIVTLAIGYVQSNAKGTSGKVWPVRGGQ